MNRITRNTCATMAAQRTTAMAIAKNKNEITLSVTVDLFIGHDILEGPTSTMDHPPTWTVGTLRYLTTP